MQELLARSPPKRSEITIDPHVEPDVIGLGGEGWGEGAEPPEDHDLLHFAKVLHVFCFRQMSERDSSVAVTDG